MRCHYEVLSLPHNAEDTEIKKSYRKLALQYHPDKNPDNIEEVTELFREVQSAYDVLSDPQERAFYDKHREEILRGGSDFVDDALDLMHYFNPSIYSGFDDGSKSFYTVFREAFCKLAKEDEPYMDAIEEELLVPEFGYSYSEYENVVRPFYVYWLSYRTKKSFVWKQVYDIRTAANRPTQRLMEKENKKLRETCRKKRNEEVRALVSYVRKRDKRVQAEVKRMKEKQEEQLRKAKEIQESQKKDRSKILENYEEQEWMAFDDSKLNHIDSHYDDMFGTTMKDEDSDEEEFENVLYCIACDKNFKSDKALANHEKSKKHKENVELIKNELEGDLFEELHIGDHDEQDGLDDQNDQRLCDHICQDMDDETCDSDSALPRLSSFNLPANVVKRNVIDKGSKSGEDYATPVNKKSKQKKKKKKGIILLDISEDSDDEIDHTDSSVEKISLEDEKKSSEEDIEGSTENKPEPEPEFTENTCEKSDTTENENTNSVDNVDEETEGDTQVEETNNKKDKKNKKNNNVNEESGSFTCEVCPKVFPTRNKLFKHIKSEGHAVVKGAPKKNKRERKEERKKK